LLKNIYSFLLIGALLVVSVGVLPSVVWADQGGAAAAVASAQSRIETCYEAAKKAEAAGANISALTESLNEAGSLLSDAEFAFSVGDFASAQDFAAQSQGKLVDFVSDASALQAAGGAKRNQDFLINVFGSICGTAAVLAGSFGLWLFLKKRYR
jgi:hypothetical protein